MRNDRCDAVREALPWLVNRSLDTRERHHIWTHLSGCDACREELREWVRWREAVQNAAPIPDANRLTAAWDAVERHVADSSPDSGPLFNPVSLPFDVARGVIVWLRRRTAAI